MTNMTCAWKKNAAMMTRATPLANWYALPTLPSTSTRNEGTSMAEIILIGPLNVMRLATERAKASEEAASALLPA